MSDHQSSSGAPYISGPPAVALTIAGSDSGGGAGIQADLKTFADFGLHGTSAITALTAQNTQGVQGVFNVSPEFVAQQIRSVLTDFGVAAIKTGMLANALIVKRVAAELAPKEKIPLVVDPVMVATSGDPLLERDAVAALCSQLIPLAEVLTPNIPEAELLLERKIPDLDAMHAAGEALLGLGCGAVVMKGGHLPGDEVVDLLITNKGETACRHPRLPVEAHGTGCTFAAALAAGLGLEHSVEEAFKAASQYVAERLAQGSRPGKGSVTVLNQALGRP